MGSGAMINPKILKWARIDAGYSPEDAASKIGRTLEQLLAWESGEAKPTFPQLRRIGKQYQRSVNFFFLNSPPTEPALPKDFRVSAQIEQQETPPKIRHAIRRRFPEFASAGQGPCRSRSIQAFSHLQRCSAGRADEKQGRLDIRL